MTDERRREILNSLNELDNVPHPRARTLEKYAIVNSLTDPEEHTLALNWVREQ